MALITNQVAYYKLDESSGNPADATGNGFTLTNNNTVTYGAGKINNGADGGTSNTNKTLSIDSALGMTGATARTYTCWVNINTAPSVGQQMVLFRHLFGGAADGNYANFAYANNSGTFEVRMPTSPGGSVTTMTLTVGTFYHIAVTVPASNAGNLTLYINASSTATTANWSQNYALTTRLALLADHALSDVASAKIDEFGIWSRVLSGSEITQLYNAGAGLQYPYTATAASSSTLMMMGM